MALIKRTNEFSNNTSPYVSLKWSAAEIFLKNQENHDADVDKLTESIKTIKRDLTSKLLTEPSIFYGSYLRLF